MYVKHWYLANIQYTWHSTMYRYCMYAYPKHWYYTVYMTQYCIGTVCMHTPNTDMYTVYICIGIYVCKNSTMYRYLAYPKHWYYTVYMTQYYVSVLYVCIPQTLILYSIHDTVLCIGTVCMHTPNTDIIQYTWHSTMYRYCMYAYPKHWYYLNTHHQGKI